MVFFFAKTSNAKCAGHNSQQNQKLMEALTNYLKYVKTFQNTKALQTRISAYVVALRKSSSPYGLLRDMARQDGETRI